LLLWTLARYDIFQYENNIKPDFSNAGGLLVYRDGAWEEWEDAEGCDVDHLIDRCYSDGRFQTGF
jgi:hypothetical protein